MTDTGSCGVGLIDPDRLRRGCFAILCRDAGMTVSQFATVAECLENPSKPDVLVYFPSLRGNTVGLSLDIASLTQLALPILLVGDCNPSHEGALVRHLTSAGVRAYVPALTTDVAATLAAIRLVQDGGTCFPTSPVTAEPDKLNALTPRQEAVFAKLRVGTSNKIIAYELGMSESTVKVHVRNIMQRMGATNRTMAVYKANHALAA